MEADNRGSNVLDVVLQAREGALGRADATASVPLEDPARYRGTVAVADLQLDMLQSVLHQVDELTGVLTADVTVSGGTSPPRVDGTVRVRDVVLRSLDVPTDVVAGRLDVALRGSRAELTGGWQAGASSASQVRITGDADWEASPRIALNLDGTDVPVDVQPVVFAIVSPAVTVRASPDGVVVGGRVAVPRADIVLSVGEGGAPLPSADVVVVERDVLEAADVGSPFPVQVDVEVQLLDDVALEGFGLSSGLRGDFTVQQAPGKPLVLFGTVSMVDGRYEAYGQSLVFEQGELVFAGPVEDTAIDVGVARARQRACGCQGQR